MRTGAAPLLTSEKTLADAVWDVPVIDLLAWSPFAVPLWVGMESAITKVEVARALANRDFRKTPIPAGLEVGRRTHVNRVAYLIEIVHNTPIVLASAGPSFAPANWLVIDGNHRLGSAIYRGAATIRATVSGSMEHAQKLLIMICHEMPQRSHAGAG